MSESPTSIDSTYRHLDHHASEIDHQYGSQVHLMADPYLLTLLARLCDENTHQPAINELVHKIYTGMFPYIINREFPRAIQSIKTRMAGTHPEEGIFEGELIRPATKAVCVDLARAGTIPSQICYQMLNYVLDPQMVRQDHVTISRQVDNQSHVTGSSIFSHKIGGPIDDAIVLIPDPMAATGSTLAKVLELYKDFGQAEKFISIHCIVTPEYLKLAREKMPYLQIYAIRIDRGLSAPEIRQTLPGSKWDQERGLNDLSYIVPGGGGFGEIMNNSFV